MWVSRVGQVPLYREILHNIMILQLGRSLWPRHVILAAVILNISKFDYIILNKNVRVQTVHVNFDNGY